jgi:hypothetical protein
MCDDQRQTCGKACYRPGRGIGQTCGLHRLSAEALCYLADNLKDVSEHLFDVSRGRQGMAKRRAA